MWRELVFPCGVLGLAVSVSSLAAQAERERKDAVVLELAYALQVPDKDGLAATAREDTKLLSGDRLALLVRGSEPMHLYVFNRGHGDSSYVRLFPQPGQRSRAQLSWDTPARIPAEREAWLRLGRRAGNEHLVLIASRTPIERLETATRMKDDRVDDTLAEIERNQRPRGVERWEDGSWTRWKTTSSQPGIALVCRIPLLHK